MSVLIEETRDGVARLTMNRPQQLNSLTSELCASLNDSLTRAAADSAIRCVLLTGAGRAFCAGQDLDDIGLDTKTPRQIKDILEYDINPIIRLIRGMDKPVVCAVNGVAAGAGANIAFCADIVIAAASARFIQAFRHIGLIPDAGGSWLLPRLAGNARALGMALLGEPLNAEKAEQWGLIWKSVADDEFIDEVEKIVSSLATGPTTALGMTKRAFIESAGHSLMEHLNLERDFQQAASTTEDYKEGINAFMNKRKAQFHGR
ncbi:MAG: 2-(1,2-epoxy-1,2-dihydrophenyl)acetyl-CoA isomerase [marine bacterium B5-7]|nr:MAG: 2-(1,2-epoxy-1,2-dihydrophenyl)acetyl-CoA isomerase [marine bacterium B5-7]